MRRLRMPALILLCGALLVPVTAPAAAQTATPQLVAVRAAHHPGIDRVVFEFKGSLPPTRSAAYVNQLIGDASGLPVRIAGRAILQIRFTPAAAHDSLGRSTAPSRTAYALPNVMTTVRSGDFEAVTTYGIGLASRQPFRVFTLNSPPRVVLDIGAAFPTVLRRVWFFNAARFTANTEPFFTPVWRRVLPSALATTSLYRLYAGPTPTEQRNGLRLLLSGSTGYRIVTVNNGVARVYLTGACTSGGSVVTVAGEIVPTLRQFASIRAVKIYDALGHTERPTGLSNSIPVCLEP